MAKKTLKALVQINDGEMHVPGDPKSEIFEASEKDAAALIAAGAAEEVVKEAPEEATPTGSKKK